MSTVEPTLEGDRLALLAAQSTGDVDLSSLDEETLEEVRKGLITRFFLAAPRQTKRAALYAKRGAGHVLSTVGQGIIALMPITMFLIGISIIAAGVAAALGLGTWALTAAFAIHPIVGWSIVAFTILACARLMWSIVGDGFRLAFNFAS